MTGDQNDCFWRLRQALPAGWFPVPAINMDGSPVIVTLIDALLWGLAWMLAFAYSLLLYIKQQTRIATASDGNLDMIAGDFFGLGLQRNANESDSSYRSRIQVQMFRARATRPALASILYQLTGSEPVIIEPQRPADCGGYGVPVLGYGVAGRYGSLLCPFQAFVEVHSLRSVGVPNVPGYGCPQGGYGAACEWAPAGSLLSLNDLNVFAAVESVRPIGTEVWVRLVDGA